MLSGNNTQNVFGCGRSITPSHLETVYDLFSLNSIMNLFGFNENEIFFLRIQDYLVHETTSIIANMETFNFFNVTESDKIFNLFNDSNFFSVQDLQNTDIFKINKTLLQNIETVGVNYGDDTAGLKLAYPNFHDLIVDYELALIEDDGSMVNDLSTPDTKLHYPEPFVASPSFVHEDL